MPIRTRLVKDKKSPGGGRTGQPGTVYDVNRKYKLDGVWKTYTKRGFLTEEEAQAHDAEMAQRFAEPTYIHTMVQMATQPLGDYLLWWLETVVLQRNRERTCNQYRTYITKHIIPHLGNTHLNQLSSAEIDDVYVTLLEAGLSDASVQGIRIVLSSALAHAMQLGYIHNNPARNSAIPLVRNRPEFQTFGCGQMKWLLEGTNLLQGKSFDWTFIITMAGIYGLRINEVLGLRWRNVDLYGRTFVVDKQLPFNTTAKNKMIPRMNPTKSTPRTLPITDQTYQLFEQLERIQSLRRMEDLLVYDNDLVLCHVDGSPLRYRTVLLEYYKVLEDCELPQARLHDLRRSAASNLYQLSGDFWAVSKILGHSISGTGELLGLGNIQCETSHYISSAVDRRAQVLQQYHDQVAERKATWQEDAW